MLVSASALQSFHLSHMASKPTSHCPLHVAGTALEEGAAKKARTMITDAYSTSAIKDAFGKYTDYLKNLNEKRERVVKASRDITMNSKKVIFQVHSLAALCGCCVLCCF